MTTADAGNWIAPRARKTVSMTTPAPDNSKKRLAAGDCGYFDPVFAAELPAIIGRPLGRP
jgi:hypothetical protein